MAQRATEPAAGPDRIMAAVSSSLAVSAIIPTYNRAHLVPRAIRSALTALALGDEIVVVDDGSTDDTADVVEGFGPPVRLLKVAHGGPGAARNAGLDAARGPLVAFLDSDDEWHPDKIVLQRSFLERRPDVLFCFSDFGVRLEDGTEHQRQLKWWLSAPRLFVEVFDPWVPYSSVAELPPGREDFPVHVGSMYLEEMRNNFIAAFTLLVRREEAGDALRFAEGIPICEEWAAFGRLARLGTGALFDTETALQYGHSGPRVTNTPQHLWASGWISALEGVWGSDPAFLAEHGEGYRHAVSEAELVQAIGLVRIGKPRAAGRALRRAGFDPVALRALLNGSRAKRSLHA